MITKIEKEKMIAFLGLLERNPKAAFTEGWRRTANLFDELEYMYSAVSSGKDSVFMTQMCIMELQRRQWFAEVLDGDDEEAKKEVNELIERYSLVRMAGLASQVSDDVEKFRKWQGMRIGVMQMCYEMEYDQTGQIMHRFYKEYATDIKNIEPKTIDPNKSVKENGYDLSWINDDDPKCNPHELSRKEIERMKPDDLKEIYGKALVWGYACYFPIQWENSQGVSDSRYISYEPDKKDIWVTVPPVQHDPHHEWVIDLDRMYDSWHGLRPMFEVIPAMSDQALRVKFSEYISKAVQEAMLSGFPERKYDSKSGLYI